MLEVLRRFEEAWRLYELTVTTAEEKALVSAFKLVWANYQDESGQLIMLSRNHDTAAATKLYTGSLRDDFSKVRKALEDDLAFNVAEGKKEADRGSQVYESARLFIFGAIAFALLLCGAAGWMIIAGVSRPIAQMTEAMKRLAGRDLTVEISGLCRKDEIGSMASAMQVFKDNLFHIKKIETELRALNSTLEQQVAERTESLQASEARLRAIFETSYQYQGLMALDGTLLDANATSLSGIKSMLEDVVGKPFWDTPWFAGTPGMPETVSEAVAVVAKGQIVRQEIFVNLPTGWRWFDFTMRPMRNEHGDIVAIVPEAVETTERHQAEEALRHSQKLEAMGELTGGVAHDFNNLLTPIIGGLDTLHRRGVGDQREQRLIEGALQAADRAKTLVQRLLAFARRQPLHPTSIDIGTLVKGMSDLVASTVGPQIKIVMEVADDLPAAKADPNQLDMAILNLVVNARDAMPDGGTLRISATSEMIGQNQQPHLKPGLYIRLSVADTGTGMDETTLAHAIEPFFSKKVLGKGTGLGLSMVHGLASQLGGALVLSSQPGLGTNAEILLPVSGEPAKASEGTPSSIPESKAIGRALLVEDDDRVRVSAADMLTELGYDVVEASSAEEALRLFNQGLRVDLVVTDHLMPGMTGSDLAREIQKNWPTTPVLIVSGYAEAEGVAPDLPRLTKPFRQPELAACIANLTAGRSQWLV